MPFQKGKSGNPAGRPARDLNLRRIESLAREHTERAIQKLVSLIDDEDGRIACMAASAVLDRGWGKPTQAIEGTVQHSHVMTYADYVQKAPTVSPESEATVQ